MKFDTPATTNPIDQLKVIGKPTDRIDGPMKTTGTAPYAYDRHDVVAHQAYGYVVGSAIAKGRIGSIDLSAAKAAPGVIAVVVAESFEQARAAAELVRVDYQRAKGTFDLKAAKDGAAKPKGEGGSPPDTAVGDFAAAFAAA